MSMQLRNHANAQPVKRFKQFLHVPTQNAKDLEKSTNSCDP